MHALLPPKLVLLLIVAMVAATVALPVTVVVDGWWRIIGCVPMCAGLALALSGSRLFERVGTNIKTFDDPDQLVATGLFAITRNPMYLGFELLLIGIAIALGSWVAALGPLAFFIAADRWYIPFEESRMVAAFGDDYEDYRRSVYRWLGRRPAAREVTA